MTASSWQILSSAAPTCSWVVRACTPTWLTSCRAAMADGLRAADAEDAARLIALGLRPRQLPSRDILYADLVRRHEQDPVFADLVDAVAAGLGLAVLAVT